MGRVLKGHLLKIVTVDGIKEFSELGTKAIIGMLIERMGGISQKMATLVNYDY